MRFVCICTALLLCFTVALCQKKPPKKVDKLKSHLSSVQAKKNQIKAQIRKTQRQAKAVMSDIERVDGKLSNLEESLDNTTDRLESGRKEQKALKSDLEIATDALIKKREQLRVRLKAMAMQPQGNAVTTLVTARDMGDLASRKWVLERIAERDRKLLDEVTALQNRIRTRKERQDQLVVEIASLKQRQETEQDNLQSVRKEKSGYLQELQQQQAELRKQYDELDAESRSIAAQIRAYQASRRGTKQEITPFRGAFLKPASGPITSGFGMRFHPILKERRMHTGLDIGAPFGSPIRAAAPGVVISAGYRKGYGYAVVIDHGGDISTLYGHCSRILTSAGQKVERGQVIAKVGSTGLSTGPHLHFEVRVKGQPVNPAGRI